MAGSSGPRFRAYPSRPDDSHAKAAQRSMAGIGRRPAGPPIRYRRHLGIEPVVGEDGRFVRHSHAAIDAHIDGQARSRCRREHSNPATRYPCASDHLSASSHSYALQYLRVRRGNVLPARRSHQRHMGLHPPLWLTASYRRRCPAGNRDQARTRKRITRIGARRRGQPNGRPNSGGQQRGKV